MKLLPILLLATLLTACGNKSEDGNSGSVQTGVDRANADVRAAEAAARRDVERNRSVGELTGKAGKAQQETPAKDAERAEAPVESETAPTEAVAAPPAPPPAEPAQ